MLLDRWARWRLGEVVGRGVDDYYDFEVIYHLFWSREYGASVVSESQTPGGQSSGRLDHADLWHTGIVVDDLEAAKAELGDQLGVTWFEGGAEILLVTADGTRSVTTAYALSRQGPHHIELGQSVPGTLWTATAPGQAHHIGYWVDDVTTASRELERRGARHVASVTIKDGVPPMCAYHQTANGLYVEVVNRAMEPMLLPVGGGDDAS